MAIKISFSIQVFESNFKRPNYFVFFIGNFKVQRYSKKNSIWFIVYSIWENFSFKKRNFSIKDQIC